MGDGGEDHARTIAVGHTRRDRDRRRWLLDRSYALKDDRGESALDHNGQTSRTFSAKIADMSFRLHDVDPIGLAMDWLETCKRKQVTALGELYTDTAVFERECECPRHVVGRAKISEYWQTKFAAPPPRPFKLEQIWPEPT